MGVSHLRTAALANHAREIAWVESNFVVSAIVVCAQFRKRGGDVHADAALVEFIARAFVVDQKFVDGVVIAIEGVVVVVAIVGVDDDARIARHHARFVIVVRRAVGIERDAVEIDFVVNIVLKSSVAHLRDFQQTGECTHGGVELPHVGRHIDGLRCVPLTILVVILVAVINEFVERHTSVNEVVGHETVDGVVRMLQIIDMVRTVSVGHIILQFGHESCAVGQVALSVFFNLEAQCLLVDAVGFHKGGVSDVAVLCIDVVKLAHVRFLLSAGVLIRFVEILVQRVAQGRMGEQVAEHLEVVGHADLLVERVERRTDHTVNHMDETV